MSLWDVDDMVCTHTCARPDQTVRGMGFSHDARWLAYSSEDNGGTIDVVGVQTGERRAGRRKGRGWRGSCGNARCVRAHL